MHLHDITQAVRIHALKKQAQSSNSGTRADKIAAAYRGGFEKGAQVAGDMLDKTINSVTNAIPTATHWAGPLMNRIAEHETGNENIRQVGGGPGRGFVQFESESIPAAKARTDRVTGTNLVSKALEATGNNIMNVDRSTQLALGFGNLLGHPRTRMSGGVDVGHSYPGMAKDAPTAYEIWADGHHAGGSITPANPGGDPNNLIRWAEGSRGDRQDYPNPTRDMLGKMTQDQRRRMAQGGGHNFGFVTPSK